MIERVHSRSRGMTLMEVVICIALLGVIISLVASIGVQARRLRAAYDAHAQRLDAVDYFFARLAADVRPCRGFADSAGTWRSDAGTLILRTAAGAVVYCAGESGVDRVELASGGKPESVRVLEAEGVKVSFIAEGAAASARSVVTTAEWTEPAKLGMTNPTLSLRLTARNR